MLKVINLVLKIYNFKLQNKFKVQIKKIGLLYIATCLKF